MYRREFLEIYYNCTGYKSFHVSESVILKKKAIWMGKYICKVVLIV